MNRTLTLVILTFMVLCCFFMPLFKWDTFEMSGLNYVLSTYIPPYKYFLLLIPFFTIILFLGGKFHSVLPLCTLLFIFMMNYVSRNSETNSEVSNIFSDTYLGFWLSLSLSLLFIFIKREKTSQES
jgi:hypothetical protein